MIHETAISLRARRNNLFSRLADENQVCKNCIPRQNKCNVTVVTDGSGV